MNPKIIKKLLAYAKQHEIVDLAITEKNGHHVLKGENGLESHHLKLPAKLETELGVIYRNLLSLAPNDLVSGAYFKTKDSTFRLSIIPDGVSEKIIINTVVKTKTILNLSHLGLGRNERHLIETFIKRRSGLVIVASADNQGKTTTLYSLLQKINRDNRTCYSLEKYSELELDEVNKIISHEEKYPTDLARILKSDSEVILIDDLSDNLLPEILKAADTGRLILAGLKADNAQELIKKINAYKTSADLEILIVFQKLIKRNCPRCLKTYLIDESEELITKYWPSEKNYKPKHFFTSQGCSVCNHSGAKGQIAVFNLTSLKQQKINILSTLASDILQKAANGLISISKFISENKDDSTKKL